jgi:hypothetical protein
MKTKLLFTFFLITFSINNYSQENKSVSEKIKIERDTELEKLTIEDMQTKKTIDSLQLKLKSTTGYKKRIDGLESIQEKTEIRLKKLELKQKTEIRLNGQLAFTELLSVQRDIKPAELFLKSQSFFNNLGDISNIKKYDAFNEWNLEYVKWFERQKKSNAIASIITNSLNIVSDISNKVPLYGSISQTITSGLTSIVSSFGRKDKALKSKTPEMIRLLNMISQFEQQKSIIDYEWELINEELKQLKKENKSLLENQFNYFNVSSDEFEDEYMEATLDRERDEFKEKCLLKINEKIAQFESEDNKGWLGDVETYMYKVQSIRMRFGQLTNRMLSNIDSYKNLIEIFNKDNYPIEFTKKVSNLSNSLEDVRNTFYDSFNPVTYIEDSATMYIGTKK